MTRAKKVPILPCEMCGKLDKLVKYRKMYLCKDCLNPDSPMQYGDDNHPLVTSNLRIEGR